MNFLKRRKILKQSNFLDLRPVRILNHESREDGLVNLMMPRFKNKYWSRMFQTRSRSEFIRIKLDPSGSRTWMLIDGEISVLRICEKLMEQYPDDFTHTEETENRVTKFLSMLYEQRYITFREIEYIA